MEVKSARRSARQKLPLAPAQLHAVAQLFAVLSEPTRLRILQHLHGGSASVGEIVTQLDIKQANASKQLGILYQTGVLGREKDGNQVLYSIRMPLVFELCTLVCNGLRDEARSKARELG